MATIIIKNNTLVTKNWGGRQYAASAQYTIEEIDRMRLLSDPVFVSDLNAGNAIVNDGSSNLTASVGITRISGVAADHFFDNSTNGFSSKTVQSAIEENRTSASGKLIAFTVGRSGSAGNAFLYFGDSGLTTNDSPIIVPENAKIVGITATSNSGNRNYDVNLNIAKVNQGTTIDRSLVYQIRNTRNFIKMDWTNSDANYLVSAGDKITVYCQSQGAAPSDLLVTIYMQLQSGANVSQTENYTSAFTITIGGITITIG